MVLGDDTLVSLDVNPTNLTAPVQATFSPVASPLAISTQPLPPSPPAECHLPLPAVEARPPPSIIEIDSSPNMDVDGPIESNSRKQSTSPPESIKSDR